MTALCFVDTETTSLDPHTRVAWDVALIRREEDGTEKRTSFFVELTNREFVAADSVSLEIGNYDERYDPLEAISKRSAAAIIAEYTDGAVLAAATPDFDALGLANILEAAGLQPKWHYKLLDVTTFANGVLLANGEIEADNLWPSSLGTVAEILGVTTSETARHTALGDAEYHMDVYDAAFNLAIS